MNKGLLLFLLVSNCCYALISQKYKSSCALLLQGTRIYCYSGGYLEVGDAQVNSASNDLYYLDLTSDEKLVIDEISDRWTETPQPDNFILEPSIAGSSAAISETSFVVDGGYYIGGNSHNKTIVYDAKSSSWSAISFANRGIPDRVYGGTAVYVPNQNVVVYWGGLSGKYPGNLVNSTTILNISQGFTWSICPGVLPNGTFTRYGHTATLINDGKSIIYIGGRLRTQDSNKNGTTVAPYQIIPMEDLLMYSTIDGSWTLNHTNADTISERYLHTATLLPKSDRILIYGGATDDGDESKPTHVLDYLLVLDLKGLTYERISEHSKSLGAGPRFGHSAILSNSTLFILFGFDDKKMLTSDTHFLSVAGSSNSQIGWLKTFQLIEPTKADELSLGAIIGISIGSVVVFLAIVTLCLIVFVKWRKEKDRKKELQNEKKRERQSWVGNYSPNEYVEPIFTPVSDMSNSSMDNVTVKNENTQYKPNQILYQPMISKDHQYNRSSSFLEIPASPKAIKPSL
ncbi:hypothetical protein K501DRAFT_310716 [Backusella circina FSU 941]|nr:hypothetical protein K501DRAFT_310716 [Backusella circina FSU 941]